MKKFKFKKKQLPKLTFGEDLPISDEIVLEALCAYRDRLLMEDSSSQDVTWRLYILKEEIYNASLRCR